MILIIYFIVTLILNVACATVFFEEINITALSIAPVVTILVGIIMALVFKSAATDKTMNDTAYSTSQPSLTESETTERNNYMSTAIVVSIPLQIPFVLFFPSVVKLICFVVLVFSLICGGIAFKIKRGKSINSRVSDINSELEEQKKKEEMGRF